MAGFSPCLDQLVTETYGALITCPLSGLALTLSAPSSAVNPYGSIREPHHGRQVKRDLHRIGGNLILVVFPFKNRDQQSAALRNWDLWGPMVRPRPWPLPVATCKPHEFEGRGSAGACKLVCLAHGSVFMRAAHQCLDALQAFTLVLAICLSIGSPKPSAVFSVSCAPCSPRRATYAACPAPMHMHFFATPKMHYANWV